MIKMNILINFLGHWYIPVLDFQILIIQKPRNTLLALPSSDTTRQYSKSVLVLLSLLPRL